MNPLNENELYTHLGDFLKTRGIEIKEGSYAKRIQQGCSILTDAVNLSQAGLTKAKEEIDQKLDQMRQVIHEKTAPKPPTPPTPAAAAKPATPPSATAAPKPKSSAKKKTAARKKRK
jgi:hypothetical protein